MSIIDHTLTTHTSTMGDKTIKCYFDGCSLGNPGPSGAGVYIDFGDRTVSEYKFVDNHATNNIAEYSALILGLELLHPFKDERIEIYGDSMLVIQQVNGKFNTRNERLVALLRLVDELLSEFPHVTIEHVPRKMNQNADKLSRMGAALGKRKN